MTWECKVCNKENDENTKECIECGAANWDLLYENLSNPEAQQEIKQEEQPVVEAETIIEEITEPAENTEEETPSKETTAENSPATIEDSTDEEENIWEKLYDDFKNGASATENTEEESVKEAVSEPEESEITTREEIEEVEDAVEIDELTAEATEAETPSQETSEETKEAPTETEPVAVQEETAEEPIIQPEEKAPSKEKIEISRTNELLEETEKAPNIYNEQAAKLIRSQKSSKKPLIISVISILLLIAVGTTVMKAINKPSKMALMEKATQTTVQPIQDKSITSKLEEIPDTLTVNNRMIYKETMDFCLNLIENKTIGYYIKTNVLTEEDLATIKDLSANVSGKPSQDQYNRLQLIYNKLIEKDVYYYHFAKFMLNKKNYQMAKNNINTLKSRFPQSKLLTKANQLLEQTKIKSSQ